MYIYIYININVWPCLVWFVVYTNVKTRMSQRELIVLLSFISNTWALGKLGPIMAQGAAHVWAHHGPWASLGPTYPTKCHWFHATFLTQKDVPNVFPANPRQMPANVFALKNPANDHTNIKPTIFYAFHATFYTQPDTPRHILTNVYSITLPP